MTPQELETKLRELYGDEHMEYCAEHYPLQFAHLAKITLYYAEQDVQRNTGELPASGLQPEASS